MKKGTGVLQRGSAKTSSRLHALACKPTPFSCRGQRENVLCTSRRFQAEQKHKNEVEHFTLSYSAQKSSKKCKLAKYIG